MLEDGVRSHTILASDDENILLIFVNLLGRIFQRVDNLATIGIFVPTTGIVSGQILAISAQLWIPRHTSDSRSYTPTPTLSALLSPFQILEISYLRNCPSLREEPPVSLPCFPLMAESLVQGPPYSLIRFLMSDYFLELGRTFFGADQIETSCDLKGYYLVERRTWESTSSGWSWEDNGDAQIKVIRYPRWVKHERKKRRRRRGSELCCYTNWDGELATKDWLW